MQAIQTIVIRISRCNRAQVSYERSNRDITATYPPWGSRVYPASSPSLCPSGIRQVGDDPDLTITKVATHTTSSHDTVDMFTSCLQRTSCICCADGVLVELTSPCTATTLYTLCYHTYISQGLLLFPRRLLMLGSISKVTDGRVEMTDVR